MLFGDHAIGVFAIAELTDGIGDATLEEMDAKAFAGTKSDSVFNTQP